FGGFALHSIIQRARAFALATLAICTFAASAAFAQTDPLPSWNEGATKKSITDFVAKVTTQGPDFVPAELRIATFDNDGKWWAEQPNYFQAIFALERVKAMAPEHPEWKKQEPFKSFLAGDKKGLAAQGEKGLLQLIMAAHAGMTTDAFSKTVADWLATSRHP